MSITSGGALPCQPRQPRQPAHAYDSSRRLMMLPNHFMCKYENTEFEQWAASRGGLKRARRSDEYSRRVDMYFKWRKSKEFKALEKALRA